MKAFVDLHCHTSVSFDSLAKPESVVRAAGGPTVNTTGVVEWGVKNVIPLLLLIIGISIIASARKGRMSENANTLTNVVIGSAVIGSAALLFAFATSLSGLLFGG